MRLGELRHQLRLERPTEGAPDDYGQVPGTWDPVAELWCKVEPLTGRELEIARVQEARVTHRITTRFLEGVTSAMRLVLGDRAFEIVSVLDVEELHDELQILAVEALA